MNGAPCSRCPATSLTYHAYCRDCRNAYSRAKRKRHSELNAEQRRKATVRAYANVYQARGVLVPPDHCERCPAPGPLEKHHPDHNDPLAVEWLCRACHVEETRTERRIA